MNKKSAWYRYYQRPDGEPFAAAGITVYSYLTEDTRRRAYAVEGLPADWPNKKCPVCGSKKKRTRKVCQACCYKIRRIMVPLTCTYCGVQFERILCEVDKQYRLGRTDLYCTAACSHAHQAIKNHRRCLVCGKPTATRRSKYCSDACRVSRRVKELGPKQCPRCGATFSPKSKRTAYCSRVCANIAHSRRMRGAGNSHYRDGTSYASWFREMRPVILDRDKHACVACGKTEKLIVHHIDHVPWNNDPFNLISLCPTCHAVHHKSNATPFHWLDRLATVRCLKMPDRLKLKSIQIEAKYFVFATNDQK